RCPRAAHEGWTRSHARTLAMPRPHLVALLLVALGCSSHPKANGPASSNGDGAGASSHAKSDPPPGAPLEFVLDPIKRDSDFPPASEQLRGKRAVILVLSSSDGTSSALLMRLGPLLRELPPDTTCMLVAMEPLENRIP